MGSGRSGSRGSPLEPHAVGTTEPPGRLGGADLKNLRRQKSALGRGRSMNKGLGAGPSEPSNVLTQTLPLVSLFPRAPAPRHSLLLSPLQLAFFVNRRERALGFLPSAGTRGSWAEPGEWRLAEVRVARKGGAHRKTRPGSRLLTGQHSWLGRPARLAQDSFHPVTGPQSGPHLPVCSLWPPV